MKAILLSMLFAVALMSCSSGTDDNNNSNQNNQNPDTEHDDGNQPGTLTNCEFENKVERLFYDNTEQSFDLKAVYGSYVKGMSYRVIFTNYEGEEFKPSYKLEGDEQNIVVALGFVEKGKDFVAGDYRLEGDENGYNKAIIQVEKAGSKVNCSYGDGDHGLLHITQLSDESICGSVDLRCNELEIKATFSALNIE